MKHDFHVGDTVLIRQWDDMAREYGVEHDSTSSYIMPADSVVGFVEGMRKLCGTEHVIREIVERSGGTFVLFNDPIQWNIMPYMIEPAGQGIDIDADEYMKTLLELR